MRTAQKEGIYLKLPRTPVTLIAVFISSLVFFAVFLLSAIRRRSIWHGIAAAIAAASSFGLFSLLRDYFRAAPDGKADFFSMDRVIDDFFDPANGQEDTLA